MTLLRNPKKRSAGSSLIIFGVLLLLVGMALQLQPLYTYASDRISVEFWLVQERMAGEPGPGEAGSLYEQLQVRVETLRGTLYSGSMRDLDTLDITDTVPVADGETVIVYFFVHLPGPDTDNVFQGSWVSTRFKVFARCTNPDGTPAAKCTLTVNPQEKLFDLRNLNPGDTYQGVMEIRVPPDLPKTGDSPSQPMFILGSCFIILGTLIKLLARGRNSEVPLVK